MQPLSYDRRGRGKVIVFLHGFCEAKEYWDDSIKVMSEHFTCISLDLPGFGSSAAIGIVSMETLAESVFYQLNSMEIDEFILVGHSLGGYVALALAEKHPKNIIGLVMCNSTAFADSDEKKLQRDKTIKFLDDNGLEEFVRPFVPPMFFPKNRKSCSKAIEEIIDMGLRADVNAVKATISAMKKRPSRISVIQNAKFPVLYIVGKDDGSIKMDDSILQCHQAAVSFVLFLDECDHQSIHEKFDIVIETILGFCKKIKAEPLNLI
ncbi:MAG: alpha/beta fold hydrolase [Cytophagales bacterium]|nr:MAG: alpha/beta fold hydrolase [Cytophagales bacterium]TAG56144.1 MAG: alpha/beta fold hydrolase [Cytophagales bacterium]